MEDQHVRVVVDRVLADQKLTRAEQEEIMAAVLADGRVSPEEQDLLNQILEQIRAGTVQVVD